MTRLDTAGSTLFKLTWKGRTTPLGRRYLERAAPARRTSGSGCTSWPSPQAHDSCGTRTEEQYAKGKLRGHGQANLNDFATLAAWHTPKANDSEKRGEVADDPRNGLVTHANLASWPTPSVNNYEQDDQQALNLRREKCKELTGNGNGFGMTLGNSARATAWASPSARDYKDSMGMALTGTNPDGSERDRTDQLPRQATLTVSGETRIGYSARDGIVTIGNGAQLNPEHSRWLMGLPRIFSECAERITKPSRLRAESKAEC